MSEFIKNMSWTYLIYLHHDTPLTLSSHYYDAKNLIKINKLINCKVVIHNGSICATVSVMYAN